MKPFGKIAVSMGIVFGVISLLSLSRICCPINSVLIEPLSFSLTQKEPSWNLSSTHDEIFTVISKQNNELSPRVKTGFAGSAESLILRWKEFAGNISSFDSALYSKKYLPRLKWLYQQGIELSVSTDWRPNPVHSITTPNPLDVYYNETFRNQVYDLLSQVFENFPEDLASGIRVGDEEPFGAYQWFYFSGDWPEEIAKYNGTYHDETGFWFKDLDKMNSTERLTWQMWMEERNAFAYNSMYSHLKTLYPEKKVIIAVMENYNLGFDASLISTDERSGYFFYTKDPRSIYSGIRFTKTTYPNADVSTTLWGAPKFGFYQPYTKADYERMAHAAYLAGVSKVSWFTLGNDERGRILHDWERTDQEAKETFDAINEINRELLSLPVFNSSPKVLEITEYDTAGDSKGIGLLEWDNTNQIHASKASFNLSRYNLVIVKDQSNLLSDFVNKLNDYVKNGGNVILLGSTGVSQTDPFGEIRPSLMIENGVVMYQSNDDPISITLNEEDPLELVVELPLSEVSRTGISFTSSPSHTIIATGISEEGEGYYPLVLYHNETNPNSGHVLYNGFEVGWDSPTLELWIESLNAFCDLIKFHEGIASVDNCKMLVSISEFPSEDKTIVGFVNDETYRDVFITSFNFTTRGYSQQPLWSYQRDRILEWFGEISYNHGEISVGISPFLREDAVLIELIPPWPAGRLKVTMHPILHTVVSGESFSIYGEVSNIMSFTEIANVQATIELPSEIILPENELATIDLDQLYPAWRPGFGYPVGICWNLKATELGNFTCKITVTGDDVESFVKYVNVEVREHAVDITLEQPRLYVVPNENYVWETGIHHRGISSLSNSKIWCRFPFNDWYAPHQEQVIDVLEPGERKQVNFAFSEWYQVAPPWSLPGEEVLVAFTSQIDGYVGEDTYGYIEVVASKIEIGIEIEEPLVKNELFNLGLIIQALGIESASEVQIDIELPSGIEITQSPSRLLGTLNPNENTTINLTMKAHAAGIYYITIQPKSANACCEKVIIPISVGDDGTAGKNMIWTYVGIGGITLVVSVATTIALLKLGPRILKKNTNRLEK